MANPSPTGHHSRTGGGRPLVSGGAPLESSPRLTNALRQHHAICTELLALAERENRVLSQDAPYPAAEFVRARKDLLSRLTSSNKAIQEEGIDWQRLGQSERERHPDTRGLLRQNQEVIMRILLLDRENEQLMLRRGLVPPSQQPSVHRQRPHFVADLYKGHSKP